jgi:hypothetical protein
MLGKIQNIRFDNFFLSLSGLPSIASLGKVLDSFGHAPDKIITAKQIDQVDMERFGQYL